MHEGMKVGENLEAEPVAQPLPPAAPEESQLNRLITKEKRLALDIKGKREQLIDTRAAFARYQRAVDEWANGTVHRPRMRQDSPEKSLESALEKFIAFNMKDHAWRDTLNRPNAAYGEWADERGEHRREAFDPENNPRYVAMHRENVVHLSEVLESEDLKVRQMEGELENVIRQIAEHDRQNGGS